MQEIDFNGSSATRIGMRTSLKILEEWGCNQEQVQALLTLPKNYNDLDFEQVSFNQEQIERISYILNIHAGLNALFSNPENIYGFMNMVNHNHLFNGAKPIDVILSEESDNFQLVINHINQLLIR
ncbi:hypothetical protein ACRN97_21910 [Shewanella baltica]|uniref:hypothetical protein n=1 Tax=Shewanella baltica TaxID=62322 RepID=UPI0039B06AEB